MSAFPCVTAVVGFSTIIGIGHPSARASIYDMPAAQIQRRDDRGLDDRKCDDREGTRPPGAPAGDAMRTWALLLFLCAAGLQGGCAAMMMGGDGGYEPPADCTADQRAAGLCKTR